MWKATYVSSPVLYIRKCKWDLGSLLALLCELLALVYEWITASHTRWSVYILTRNFIIFFFFFFGTVKIPPLSLWNWAWPAITHLTQPPIKQKILSHTKSSMGSWHRRWIAPNKKKDRSQRLESLETSFSFSLRILHLTMWTSIVKILFFFFLILKSDIIHRIYAELSFFSLQGWKCSSKCNLSKNVVSSSFCCGINPLLCVSFLKLQFLFKCYCTDELWRVSSVTSWSLTLTTHADELSQLHSLTLIHCQKPDPNPKFNVVHT